jgi:hypothetical protein
MERYLDLVRTAARRAIAAIGILALGLALTVGGLADRLSRKSPA